MPNLNHIDDLEAQKKIYKMNEWLDTDANKIEICAERIRNLSSKLRDLIL